MMSRGTHLVSPSLSATHRRGRHLPRRRRCHLPTLLSRPAQFFTSPTDQREVTAKVMPNPFGMFGSDAGSAPTSTPQSRSASPAQTPAVLPPAPLRRPASHGRLAQLMVPGKGRARSSSTASQEVVTTNITVHADDSPLAGRTTPEQRRRSARGESPTGHADHSRCRVAPCQRWAVQEVCAPGRQEPAVV